MKCLFVCEKDIYDDTILVDDKDFHHAIRVYRLELHEKIELKSEKYSYLCQLANSPTDKLAFRILSKRSLIPPKLNVTLCQSLIKKDAFDYLLQKVTEIGVTQIIPYASERSITHFKDPNRKITRWRKICEEASKQCGRDFIPKITPIIKDLNELNLSSKNRIIANELIDEPSLRYVLKPLDPSKEIIILVGPEGGFTDHEIHLAHELGFSSCSISQQILRSDTASLSIVANLFFYFS